MEDECDNSNAVPPLAASSFSASLPQFPQQSVIVHTQHQHQQMTPTMRTTMMVGTADEEEVLKRKRRERKRTRKEGEDEGGGGGGEEDDGDEEEEEGDEDGKNGGRRRRMGTEGRRKRNGLQGRGPMSMNELSSPAVLVGVRKFISPFAPEATIPLPHELEQSANGTTVWKRNERERQRVRNLNDGYAQLREGLPLIDRDRRMSKVDSLRLAIAYIGHLEHLLQRGNAHWMECECFRQSYGSGGDGSSAENTPPPQN